MITIDRLSKAFGSRVLFEGVTLTFNPGARYGLTGPNGAGKSTLLRIIMGYEEATSGTVTLPGRVGILRQDIEYFRDMNVLDVVVMGNQRLWAALQKREVLYNEEPTHENGMRLGELEDIVAEEIGWEAESRAAAVLSGMEIGEEMHQQKMHEIPTDMQFRVLLCQALFGPPQALLLDEPTNHLDLVSIGWLETFLHEFRGALVVVSHDRHFLNSICTHIADLDYETLIVYPGNYDDMVAAKSSVRERAESENKSKEKKASQLREYVARFSAGTRASQVQSRIKEIQKLEPQELKKSNIQRPYIRFATPARQSGQVVLKGNGVRKSYDKLDVIKGLSLEIVRGDKIGVIGSNGSGKTTLLKMLAQVLAPDKGSIELGHQAEVNYFPQNHNEIVDKSEDANLFDWLRSRKRGVSDQEIRAVLGKMLFGGDDAFKKLGALSGGETARLILAGMMLSEHNVLILDEPNNHLDLEAVSALGWGLTDYKGTAIVASHDRSLIEAVATKIIAFEEDGIHVFNDTLEAYLKTRQQVGIK